MLDLETMSTHANAAIVSMGACANDGRPDFYARVDLQSCMALGLKVDASTIMWWLQQEKAAQLALCGQGHSLSGALQNFAKWLKLNNQSDDDHKPVECELWAFPASFDVTILEQAYKALGMRTPWHYRAPRCLRTAAALFPNVPKVTATTKHDALADAKAQMQWLEAILQEAKAA